MSQDRATNAYAARYVSVWGSDEVGEAKIPSG
jgi:hypothetical protein